MPTHSSELVSPPTVRKSCRGKENCHQNNCKSPDFEAELSESEASPAVERTTTKKGNSNSAGNLKGRKKNTKGGGNANGKSKKKAAEEDLRVADLTAELEKLREQFDSLQEEKVELLEELRTKENHAITIGAKLIKLSGEANASAKLSSEAKLQATNARKELAELEKASRIEKKEIANAHERSMQLLKEMHVLDKNNLATELAATKAALASSNLELVQTKKLLETSRSEHIKFLRDQRAEQDKVEHNTIAAINRSKIRVKEKEKSLKKSRKAGIDKFALACASSRQSGYYQPFDPRMAYGGQRFEDDDSSSSHSSSHSRSRSSSRDRGRRSHHRSHSSRSRSSRKKSRHGSSHRHSSHRSHSHHRRSRSRSRSRSCSRSRSSSRSRSCSRSSHNHRRRSGGATSSGEDKQNSRRISDESAAPAGAAENCIE